MTARRVAWWALVIAMVVAIVVTAVLGVARTRQPAQAADVPTTAAPLADSAQARKEATDFGSDAAVRILSYTPDTAQQKLTAAAELTTEPFKSEFQDLITKVVIPTAKEQAITTRASVAAAGVEELDDQSAVLLVYVNQTVTKGADAPTDTQSSVRMTLERIDGRWLVSKFEPV